MKGNKKERLFFVKEMPENEEIDISKAQVISHNEIDRLLKESQKRKIKKPKKS